MFTYNGGNIELERTDYMDPTCPFDTSGFIKKSNINASVINVKNVLSEADALYSAKEYGKAQKMLEAYLQQSLLLDDKAAELGLLSELIGSYRKSGDEEKGIAAVNRAFELIKILGLEGTATAGTIWLNGATTLREFRRFQEAIPFFIMASRAYSNTIPPDDYRFASLYNNMASCLEAIDRNEEAIKYYNMALGIVKGNSFTPMEEAITYINLAELYDKIDPSNPVIEEYVNKCMAIFADDSIEHDEYYSYNAKSCAKGLNNIGYFRDAKELVRRANDIDDEIS